MAARSMTGTAVARDRSAPRYAPSVQMSAHSEQTIGTTLGEALRGYREDAGLSLRAAAERAGMSPAHLSEVERGLKEPSFGALSRIAGAIGVGAGEVFLDLAIALGAAPPRPARRPMGFAPDPIDEIEWAAGRLHQDDLRALAAFGAFLATQNPTNDQGVTTT
ncbi:MAG: helix-turn-helix transcriptional regulator [Actinobacteria bacterium]|nr:helix-turn-helix transcriptional regulator [Actinomycetota bacterium]